MIRESKVHVRSAERLATAGLSALALACALYAVASFATDADDYLRHAAQRDVAMFDTLDRDRDGRLMLDEVRGNIDFEARFNDFDINRDGLITRKELVRYIALQYGIAAAPR